MVESAEYVTCCKEGCTVLNGVSATEMGECIGCLFNDCPTADIFDAYDKTVRGVANCLSLAESHEVTKVGTADHSNECDAPAMCGTVGVDCNYMCCSSAVRECVS